MVPTPPAPLREWGLGRMVAGALQRTWLALGCGAANHKLRRGIAHQLRQHLVVALQTTNCVVASRINCDSAATCRVLQNEQIALQRITRTAPQTRPQRHAHTGASCPMWGRGGQGRPPGWTHTIGGGGAGDDGRREHIVEIYIYIYICRNGLLSQIKCRRSSLLCLQSSSNRFGCGFCGSTPIGYSKRH